jgi:hypothetical protein
MPDPIIPDPRKLDDTQEGKPVRVPAPPQVQPRTDLPPRSGRGQGPMPKEKRKNNPPPPSKRDNAMYLPAWSLGLMLLFVLGLSFAVVLAVLALGGQFEPAGDPIVVIITAIPSSTPPINSVSATLGVPTLRAVNDSVPQFPLEGPTLQPIVLSPTPLSISVGVQVRVNEAGLNIRAGAGLDQEVRFTADFGLTFSVVGGPEEASGITWWQVADPLDPTRSGWAAASYLEVLQP